MLDLVSQKSAALHSVLDRVAQDTDVAALLEQVAAESAMMQVAKAILADPEPVLVPVEVAQTALEALPVETIQPEQALVEIIQPEPPKQLPLFGQLLPVILTTRPRRKPEPAPSAMQLSLFATAS